jgi:hypothetical protein
VALVASFEVLLGIDGWTMVSYKVCGPCVVTLILFEWHMTRLIGENGHPKKTMRLNSVQKNTLTIPSLIVNNWEGVYVFVKRERESSFWSLVTFGSLL